MKTVFQLIEDNGLTLHGDIEHFAELVRADERDRAMRENAYVLAEREACAEMFDEAIPLMPFAQNDQGGCLMCGFTPKLAAEAIRARGQALAEKSSEEIETIVYKYSTLYGRRPND